MTDDPSLRELAKLLRDALGGPHARHGEPAGDGDYDAAFERANKTTLRAADRLVQRQAVAKRLEALLAKDGLAAIEKLPHKFDDLALFEALLARSWALRHEDLPQMVQLARLAVQKAGRLDARRYGVRQVADLQCRAWAELGNALRATDRLDQALNALAQARELFELGSGDEFLDVRLTELEATFAADRRQFSAACLKLTKVYRFHRRHRNHDLAGKALIKQGLYTGYSGELTEGITLLRRGHALLDQNADPALIYCAAHNEMLFLIDSGRLSEAKRLRLERSRDLALGIGLLNRIKFQALEARLDAAQGKYERAAANFEEVRLGYEGVKRGYDAALTGLDLAAVLLHLRRSVEAREHALAAVKMFMALGIEREGLVAVILIRESFEMRIATPDLLQRFADYLRLAPLDPDTPFNMPPIRLQ